MIKTILFLLLTVSLALPLTAFGENYPHPILYEMQKKIIKTMDEKSKLPESKQNSSDYWCLSDHLLKIVEGRMTIKHPGQYRDDPYLAQNANDILEKYSADENFVDHEKPSLTGLDRFSHFQGNSIIFINNIEKPLKIAKAQEIITAHENVAIYRLYTWTHQKEQCSERLEEMLGISAVKDPQKLSSINLRGDIISADLQSTIYLAQRGYVVLPLDFTFMTPSYYNYYNYTAK